jgi:hypothetical protein
MRRPSTAQQRRNELEEMDAIERSFRPLKAGGDIAARCPYRSSPADNSDD